MATADTVTLGRAHPPKEESIKAFNEIEVELKAKLQHMRHEMTKHEPEYFAAVKNLSDKQLTTFSSDDLKEVRVASSAYGLHLFGKVLLPESDPSHSYPEKASDKYFHFRAFIPGDASSAQLHSIHTEEVEKPDGDRVYRAIFSLKDPLEWFDT
ncbi:unnamed protein product [Diplocarpon coronariae]|uniref:Uncharacterized protein n=1 Tax=Diplocarpon coronariae TaxID=2795749 RepID=A0A218Z5C7_9HELO|nr:hypothetical protein JHW43_004430 [Diplocarpon mali]OWP03257.1 hypothetical protein B2J93_2989 [Marssonina coronariae]